MPFNLNNIIHIITECIILLDEYNKYNNTSKCLNKIVNLLREKVSFQSVNQCTLYTHNKCSDRSK